MSRFQQLVVAFSVAAISAIPGTSAAEPVQITSGYLMLGGLQDFTSRGFMRQIAYDLVTDDFRIQWSDSDYFVQNPAGPNFPRPTNYSPTGGAVELGFLDFERAPVVTATPSLTPTPFSLVGAFRITHSNGELLFDGSVFGAGTATWQYTLTPFGDSVVSGVRYEFSDAAPTPEPATILLIGSGIAGLMVRRRRSGH